MRMDTVGMCKYKSMQRYLEQKHPMGQLIDLAWVGVTTHKSLWWCLADSAMEMINIYSITTLYFNQK